VRTVIPCKFCVMFGTWDCVIHMQIAFVDSVNITSFQCVQISSLSPHHNFHDVCYCSVCPVFNMWFEYPVLVLCPLRLTKFY
jgi:hypothetical protein